MSRMESVTDLPLVGGNLALDFVNTSEGRGGSMAGDALGTGADLRTWGRRVGVIGHRASADDESELARAIEARELLYALFSARVADRPVAPELLAAFSELAAGAYAAGSLRTAAAGGLEWSWDPSRVSSVRHTVVVGAAELLGAPHSQRLKQCPGDHCGWFFLDTTKRGNRRWCSMSTCGQEAKNLRRRRAAPKPAAHRAS